MRRMLTDFPDRASLIAYLQATTGVQDLQVSSIRGGARSAKQKIAQLDLEAYRHDRNHFTGHVSGLSPYIRHGLISMSDLVKDLAASYPSDVRARFVQQCAWRDYFQRVHQTDPCQVWQDREAYKTGFSAQDYADELPLDIQRAQTGVRLIDQMIQRLLSEGYLHNHARLYLAAYVVHWRRVKWQAGAKWFLSHLLDGDIASNNYSWQWVASTFSAKPYIFNLENVQRFAGDQLDVQHQTNQCFNMSYESLSRQLFPNFQTGA